MKNPPLSHDKPFDFLWKKLEKSMASVNLVFSQFSNSNSARSLFQSCQGPFDPTSAMPYFLLFQTSYASADCKKYDPPKILSLSKRSVNMYKLVKKPKQMCLRYTAAQCSECNEYFSLNRTTKHWKTWEDLEPPKISRKLLEERNIFICTDCIWVQEALDDAAKTPPTSPLISVPNNSPSCSPAPSPTPPPDNSPSSLME